MHAGDVLKRSAILCFVTFSLFNPRFNTVLADYLLCDEDCDVSNQSSQIFQNVFADNVNVTNNEADYQAVFYDEGGTLSEKYALSDFEGSGSDVMVEVQNAYCIEPGYEKICSGEGRCMGQTCVCNSLPDEISNEFGVYSYSGKYCEECPYCRAQRCSNFLKCVECHIKYQHTSAMLCESICQYPCVSVDKVTRNIDNDDKICDVEDGKGCYVKFKYTYDKMNNPRIEFEKEVVCFNGMRLALLAFWGVVLYLFLLMFIVPRLCLTEGICGFFKRDNEDTKNKRRNSRNNNLRQTADFVRFNTMIFNE